MVQKEPIKFVVRNKKARHDYFVEETFEAGVSLLGSEVKALRDGRGNLSDAFAEVRGGELVLVGSHIGEYVFANQFNHVPRRDRKLLMHKGEIAKLRTKVEQRGYTLIPLALYLKNGKIKAELGLCKGKKHHDKRQSEREREGEREARAAMSCARRS